MKDNFEDYKKDWEIFRWFNKEEHQDVKEGLDDIKRILTAFILEVKTTVLIKKEAEKKFASKLTQTLVYWMVWFMLMAVLWGLTALVIK